MIGGNRITPFAKENARMQRAISQKNTIRQRVIAENNKRNQRQILIENFRRQREIAEENKRRKNEILQEKIRQQVEYIRMERENVRENLRRRREIEEEKKRRQRIISEENMRKIALENYLRKKEMDEERHRKIRETNEENMRRRIKEANKLYEDVIRRREIKEGNAKIQIRKKSSQKIFSRYKISGNKQNKILIDSKKQKLINEVNIKKEEKKNEKNLKDEENEYFGICPITQEYMKNPVLAPSGNYYEKDAILEWIKIRGNDPLTREPLSPDMLIEDNDYRNAIIEFRKKNNK